MATRSVWGAGYDFFHLAYKLSFDSLTKFQRQTYFEKRNQICDAYLKSDATFWTLQDSTQIINEAAHLNLADEKTNNTI